MSRSVPCGRKATDQRCGLRMGVGRQFIAEAPNQRCIATFADIWTVDRTDLRQGTRLVRSRGRYIARSRPKQKGFVRSVNARNRDKLLYVTFAILLETPLDTDTLARSPATLSGRTRHVSF